MLVERTRWSVRFTELGEAFIAQLAIDAELLSSRRIKAVPLCAAAERRIAMAWRTGSARADDFRALAGAITTTMRS